MKVGIDSYCYHRFFGEVYAQQRQPAKRMTPEDFLDRAQQLVAESMTTEAFDDRDGVVEPRADQPDEPQPHAQACSLRTRKPRWYPGARRSDYSRPCSPNASGNAAASTRLAPITPISTRRTGGESGSNQFTIHVV